MLESTIRYFESLSVGWFYFGLFLTAYVENVFPPIPGDTVVAFAAFWVGKSHGHFGAVLLSTTLGSTAGFMTYYALGRLIHPEYFIRRDFKLFPASSFVRVQNWFRHYGYWVVLLNRFASGVRGVISIACGISRLPWLPVLVLSFVGCGVWNVILIWAGYSLGANWRSVQGILNSYSRILAAVAVLTAAAWLGWRYIASRKQ